MARPIKIGLDYFPLDTNLDRKFQILEAKQGIVGFAIITKLLQRIYGENGYYLEFSEIDALLFGSPYGLSAESVLGCIDTAIEVGIFDGGLYQTYKILTSHGIQTRFVEGASKRKRVDMKKEYLLLCVHEIPVNVVINSINDAGNSKKVVDNTQRKGKESKGKESKGKKKETAATAALRAYEKYIGIVTPAVAEGIDFYISQREMQPELVIRIIEYAAEQGKRSWQYINKALLGNLQDNVLDIDTYNRHQAERAERGACNTSSTASGPPSPRGEGSRPKKSKFNNYEDTNNVDYGALEEQLLNDMVEGIT
ncbi:MAG: DUF4373 domain-containing protein [Clostridia bacterium]|nr:DUF4373 domain-containing protein [Clostridia bacterium]